MHVKVILAAGATAAIVLLSAVPAAMAGAACEDSADFGAILDQSSTDQAVKALPPEALEATRRALPAPRRIILRDLPAVAEQGTSQSPGSPGTCEAQSFGYGLGSYTATHDAEGRPLVAASVAQNSTSAAWLYTLIQSRAGGQCPKGTLALSYLAQLTAHGAPSRAQVPYQPNCTYLNAIDVSTPLPGMDRFRIGSYAVIPVSGNSAAVAQIRAHLAARQVVAFSGRVLCGYAQKPVFENGVIYEKEIVPDSGHGQLLVGYDDGVGTAGKAGAFLVQNSFGTSWPPEGSGSKAPPGKAFWSYDTFASTQFIAAVAYPRATSITGAALASTPPSTTRAVISRARQWVPQDGSAAYLILVHAFSGPVMLNTVTLSEPNGSAISTTARYGQYISAGYSYLRRADGKSFLPGRYAVALSATDLDGRPVTYRGSIDIPGLVRSLPAATMAGAAITGPTGAAATVNGAP